MRKIAFLVGNDTFPKDPSIPPLRFTQNDAQEFAAVLEDPETCGFETRLYLNRPSQEVLTDLDQISFTGGVNAIVTPGSQTGLLGQLSISNSQFNKTGTAIALNTGLDEFTFTNNLFLIPANQAGVVVRGNAWSIHGNQFRGLSATGSTGIVVIPSAGVAATGRGMISGMPTSC